MPKTIIQYQKTNETFFLQTETWNLTLCSVVHLVNGLQNSSEGFIGTKFYRLPRASMIQHEKSHLMETKRYVRVLWVVIGGIYAKMITNTRNLFL